MNNIVFIGGIYGVGKTTVANALLEMDSRLGYMRASQLLFDADPSVQRATKYSHDDLAYNQGLIADEALKRIEAGKLYLFDGHFSFINKTEDGVELPPFSYFEKLNPILFVILTEDVSVIHERLKKRDDYHYGQDFLELMQKEELKEAQSVSEKLGTPLYNLIGDNTKTDGLEERIVELLNKL
ncbi:MAG: AAA family ATPase [bacterium]|nr:AAA family ATPase [bacterium]